ncbi:MAG TPA: hypothetical protein VKA08_01440 [Balneolales bacterium]|nr:hypothetical protein [Balneolales bacterium]
MIKKYLLITPLVLLLLFTLTWQAKAQQTNTPYHIRFFPDIWYNSVDAARIGMDVRGGQAGNTALGYHRLSMGVWLATRFPKDPVSYYLRFREPIESWSDYNAGASVGILSEYRTGFTRHGLELSKRWQPGFEEGTYDLLQLGFYAEKLYTTRYELFPQLWNNEWHYLGKIHFSVQRKSGPLSSYLSVKTWIGFGINTINFTQAVLQFSQMWKLGAGFGLHYRLFGGVSSGNIPVQYKFFYSMASPHDWKTNPFMRSRGTIPPVWMREGWIQYAGGPGLRGYLYQDMYDLKNNKPNLMQNVASVNTEIIYPNPISSLISSNSMVSNFLSFRSYLFADAGEGRTEQKLLPAGGIQTSTQNEFRADAGPGLALSITFPDNEGQTKTITFRYDVPLWLSSPMPGTPSFKYRSVFGLNAIIPFK